MVTGIIIGLLIALCIVLLYDKFKPKIKEVDTPKTAEELRKEEEIKDHYDNLMNYTSDKAYGGGKVNG